MYLILWDDIISVLQMRRMAQREQDVAEPEFKHGSPDRRTCVLSWPPYQLDLFHKEYMIAFIVQIFYFLAFIFSSFLIIGILFFFY